MAEPTPAKPMAPATSVATVAFNRFLVFTFVFLSLLDPARVHSSNGVDIGLHSQYTAHTLIKNLERTLPARKNKEGMASHTLQHAPEQVSFRTVRNLSHLVRNRRHDRTPYCSATLSIFPFFLWAYPLWQNLFQNSFSKPAAMSANLEHSPMNARLNVSVGPLRCLARITSASPGRSSRS